MSLFRTDSLGLYSFRKIWIELGLTPKEYNKLGDKKSQGSCDINLELLQRRLFVVYVVMGNIDVVGIGFAQLLGTAAKKTVVLM
jgi:hypothetical protein